MHCQSSVTLTLSLLAVLAIASPVAQPLLSTPVRSVPDLVKRIDLGPSQYPYGTPLQNEFSWHGWDPNDNGQKADAQKIHDAYDDWTNMVAFAWTEADQKTDSFKRWFDEGDADNVKKVLERLITPTGIQQPTEQMKDWICEKDDIIGGCKPGKNAYSVSNKGQFHMCPPAIALPRAKDLKCSDLDGFASVKIKSVAFTMMHESTHWTKVGDAALGKHITDKANGASDCFNLSPADKLINAQNYAYLGAEAYFKRKQCTFTDPPPGTKGTDDTGDDILLDPSTFAGGWCGMHVTQYQKNEPGDSPTSNNPEYQLEVCIFDSKQVLLNQYPGGAAGDCGTFVALNGQAQAIDTALPYLMYVTVGAVDDDAVLFNYGDQSWGSNDQPHHSDFGAYDSGKREGDTGFSC